MTERLWELAQRLIASGWRPQRFTAYFATPPSIRAQAFKHLGWLGHGSYGDVQLCQVSTAAAKTLLGEDIHEASAQQFVALKTWRAAHHDHKVRAQKPRAGSCVGMGCSAGFST